MMQFDRCDVFAQVRQIAHDTAMSGAGEQARCACRCGKAGDAGQTVTFEINRDCLQQTSFVAE